VEKALSEKYDLIITGVDLPCFSGLEAAQKIRKAGNNTPIAAIMEVGYHYDMQTALKAGCNESLAKPINIEKLKSILCRYGIE
jgi:DNA-binding response OmpR family regulator